MIPGVNVIASDTPTPYSILKSYKSNMASASNAVQITLPLLAPHMQTIPYCYQREWENVGHSKSISIGEIMRVIDTTIKEEMG